MPFRPPSLALLASLDASPICFQCARRLARSSPFGKRTITRTSIVMQVAGARANAIDKSYFFHKSYSWAELLRDGRKTGLYSRTGDENEGVSGITQAAGQVKPVSGFAQAAIPDNAPLAEEPPHRRRKRLKAEAALAAADIPLPPDASSTLSTAASAAPPKSLRRTMSTYLALTKPRLAFLIVLTTTASYSIYPVPALLSASATAAPSLSALTLLFLTSGTFLTIASANTLNMLFEPSHDAKMSRTRNRPLVRKLVSKRAALIFAIATGVLGTGALWYGVNPTTAVLGAGNIALYAFAYTPLKRIHPINTWVGALVGAIPPLMGWCAAASQYQTTGAVSSGLWDEMKELLFTEQATGGWLLAALLFAWQFPHFWALSHAIRFEYASAGYKMLSSTNTPMCTRVALRYSLAMFPICAGLSYFQVTDNAFVVTSGVVNAWMLREAVQFWKFQGEKGSARGLFWASVWHLPIVLVLAMAQKKGLWERMWRSLNGEADMEDEWEYEED